ncbi:pentapeptide repeat-containing protein [Streptomyces virginiae]|uniref:pentapeptide repeat-containing protein n=1 Tax=Streptomyces virginiae TaxID=1961 RepID=UPI0036884045
MTVSGQVLLAVLGLLGVLGAAGAIFAWRMAVREPEREPRIEVLAGIGGGLITGIAVGVSALFLEQALEESQKYATWRANVEVADSIPGFTPGGRDISGINLSGKSLRDADLKGVNLRKAQLRDTDLRGAELQGAEMQGANLIGANFFEADLTGAHLDGAQLESANFTRAVVNGEEPIFVGATVNSLTCWPADVDTNKLKRELAPRPWVGDFHWGQRLPNCTLWSGNERIG